MVMGSSGFRPYVAREGWLFIVATAASGFVAEFYFGLLAALPLWFFCFLLLYLFRDPTRLIPPSPLGVVAPADGTVVALEQVHDHYLERAAIKVSMRMNRLGSYTTRAPIEGKIMQYWYAPAAQSSASSRGDAALERYAMWLQSDENDDVVLMMGVARWAFKPICYHHSGERIGQGERCGLVRFGGYIEVLLPLNSRVEVAVGDSVTAGSDILAMLVHQVTPEAPHLWGRGNSELKSGVS